ncbi:MAG: gamma-glutamyltransferase, partial [Ignavibacteriales bacterium]|nr:gamma-glutamyltransferase [Ignavibacteriales bacterium]
QKYPGTAKIYLPEGFPLQQGDTLRQPDLAITLRAIAQQGRKGFYEGPVAEHIVKGVTENDGAMTLDDLKNYEAVIGEPVHGTYRGYEIISADAPQSGASIIQAMNMLENANIKAMGHFTTSTNTAHLMAETMRRVYADRTSFTQDPKFAYIPTQGLISKDYALVRYNDINMSMADPPDYRKTKAGNPLIYDAKPSKRAAVQPEKKQEFRERDDADDESAPAKRETDPFDNWGQKRKAKSNESSTESEKKEKGTAPEEKKMENPEKKEIESSYNLGGTSTGAEDLAFASEYAQQPMSESGGHTTHLSVADKDGNIVSLTQTLGTFFGSGYEVDGVLLNCSLTNFSTTASVNSIEPNKQPRSSIAPTIILKDGKPYMSVGSPGAGRIVATVIQLIVNAIDFGMDAGANNRAPRFFCQKFDDYFHLESNFSDEVKIGLKNKGHNLREHGMLDLFFGGAQIIMIDQATHTFYGSADPRRGGAAIGD